MTIPTILLVLALIFTILSFIWSQYPLVQVALLLTIISLIAGAKLL